MAPKVNRKRYNLADVHAQFAEAVGGEEVEFDAEGGTYTFPHPVFAEEEWATKVDAAENAAEKGRALLGDEQYEKYRAAGNSDNDLGLLFMAVQQDSQGQIRKRPTR
ncbi:hypothetical protein ACFWHG_19095 [Streptomyces microflavus]|uniref:hypothetical protein n=1 Tax=Streptomyces microflavus TaxID=1919 RepID=UPI003662D0DC